MKLTRQETYNIVGRDKADRISSRFMVDTSLYNCYYLEVNDKSGAPRLIRDYIDTLKITIPDKTVYVLTLEKIDLRTTDNRKKHNDKNRRRSSEDKPDVPSE